MSDAKAINKSPEKGKRQGRSSPSSINFNISL